MEFTAEMIASFLNGEIIGNKDIKVVSVAKIEDGKEGMLSFLANPKYEHYIYNTNSSIVIVGRDFTPTSKVNATLIKVDDAYSSFAQLLELYDSYRNTSYSGISTLSSIDKDVITNDSMYIGDYSVIEFGVKLGSDIKIFPQVYIGRNVIVGDNVTMYPGVKIYNECVIGSNVILHSGCVIGSDGFGFAPQSDGTYKKIPQIGNVVIEDNVEIGANSCIDRATMGSTTIHKGVKLDNLIQVAHNVTIGENTVIAAQTGIAGSSQIGDNCMLAGQVGVAGHLKVPRKTIIGSQSGVASAIKKEGMTFLGTPAIPVRSSHKSSAIIKKLPEINLNIYKLEKEVKELKELLYKSLENKQ